MLGKYSQIKAFALGTEIIPMTRSLPSGLHSLEEEADKKLSFKFKNTLTVQWWCVMYYSAWEQSPVLELNHRGISRARIGDLIRDSGLKRNDCALELNTKKQTEKKVIPG